MPPKIKNDDCFEKFFNPNGVYIAYNKATMIVSRYELIFNSKLSQWEKKWSYYYLTDKNGELNLEMENLQPTNSSSLMNDSNVFGFYAPNIGFNILNDNYYLV